jgi:arylformamidase
MPIRDITIPMRDSLACWPGDAPFRFTWTCRKTDGASVNVGQLQLSVHTGTHADAPYHFDDNGRTADALDLEHFIGPAKVVHLPGRAKISRKDLEPFDFSGSPRLLLRTGAWTDHAQFPTAIPVMDEDVPAWLHEQRIVLIGVDLPSVDVLDSKNLPNHHALGTHGITILEGLNLADVPPGRYELLALPIRIENADGAPVRAILRDLPKTASDFELAYIRRAPLAFRIPLT